MGFFEAEAAPYACLGVRPMWRPDFPYFAIFEPWYLADLAIFAPWWVWGETMWCFVVGLVVVSLSLFSVLLTAGGGVVGESLVSPDGLVCCARTGTVRALAATSAIAILRNMTLSFLRISGPRSRPRRIQPIGP